MGKKAKDKANIKFWQEFEKTFFSKTITRKILEVLCSLLTNVSIGLIPTNYKIALGVGIPSLTCLLGLFILYTFYDAYKNKKINDYDNLKKLEKACETSLITVKAVEEPLADSLYGLLNELQNPQNAKQEYSKWDVKQISEIICARLLDIMSRYCEADNIDINYFSIVNNQFRVIAYDNTRREEPKICGKNFHKKNFAPGKYYFEKVISSNQHNSVVLNKDEIRKQFYFESDLARENCPYDCYVGIPIQSGSNTKAGKRTNVGYMQITFSNIKGGLPINGTFIATALVRPIATLIDFAQNIRACIDIVGESR